MKDILTSWNILQRDLAPVSEHKIVDITLPMTIQATWNHWNVQEVTQRRNFVGINKVAKKQIKTKPEMIWLHLAPFINALSKALILYS